MSYNLVGRWSKFYLLVDPEEYWDFIKILQSDPSCLPVQFCLVKASHTGYAKLLIYGRNSNRSSDVSVERGPASY